LVVLFALECGGIICSARWAADLDKASKVSLAALHHTGRWTLMGHPVY
jgi:hypothetical protein